MSPEGPTGFYVQVTVAGSLLLGGELDMTTVQDLQDKIDEILVPGTPIVMDLAQLHFLDSSAIHCFIRVCEQSGHPVVLDNASPTVRRILDLVNPEPEAWIFDGQGGTCLRCRVSRRTPDQSHGGPWPKDFDQRVSGTTHP